MIKLVVKENLFMLTAIFTKENGSTTKPMVMGNIYTIMELNILDIGKMINSTDKGKKHGQVRIYIFFMTRRGSL